MYIRNEFDIGLERRKLRYQEGRCFFAAVNSDPDYDVRLSFSHQVNK